MAQGASEQGASEQQNVTGNATKNFDLDSRPLKVNNDVSPLHASKAAPIIVNVCLVQALSLTIILTQAL